MSLQLSSEQSVGDVWIAQLDRKRVPHARSSGCGCKSSVAVTAECSRYHASRNVSWPQSAECCLTWGSDHQTDNDRRTRQATLNLTRSRMGSQWSSRSTGVMWSRRRVPVISRAVAFCTDCNLRSRVSGKP